jgi:hypothetical protein
MSRAPRARCQVVRLSLFAMAAMLSSCAVQPPAPLAGSTVAQQPGSCQIVFDAGSSGTRLFIYQRTPEGWKEHPGPRTSALADPIRQIRGKSHADIGAVTSDVVAQLDKVRTAGPLRPNGRPEWAAFDWSTHCKVTHASVLATAGMRLAEQQNAERSRELWGSLRRKLSERLGQGVDVTARTLTGFEEGLYAWLAVRETRSGGRFGIAEMGGASSQVAFPCPSCDVADDAVRTVTIKGQPVRFYSYSFLGLGQDEAPRALGMPSSCAHGIALKQPGWQRSDCETRIDISSLSGVVDPYNFGRSATGARGTSRTVPTSKADAEAWLLTGAFRFMDSKGVAHCCEAAGQCFDAPNSCFRAVYLDKYLRALGIPSDSVTSDASWTYGAALCTAEQCLGAAAASVCRWSPSGCIQ